MGQCALLVDLHWTISIMFIVSLSHCMVENKLSLSSTENNTNPTGRLAVDLHGNAHCDVGSKSASYHLASNDEL